MPRGEWRVEDASPFWGIRLSKAPQNHEPLPVHINAKAEDLPSLMGGVVTYDERVRKAGVDAVVIAASLAFGFVYIHPFEDGRPSSPVAY